MKTKMDYIAEPADKLEVLRREKQKRLTMCKEKNPASGCTRQSDCSQVRSIDSAYHNMSIAGKYSYNARDTWCMDKWNDTIMWINSAIAQLESARSIIQYHVANATNQAQTRERL